MQGYVNPRLLNPALIQAGLLGSPNDPQVQGGLLGQMGAPYKPNPEMAAAAARLFPDPLQYQGEMGSPYQPAMVPGAVAPRPMSVRPQQSTIGGLLDSDLPTALGAMAPYLIAAGAPSTDPGNAGRNIGAAAGALTGQLAAGRNDRRRTNALEGMIQQGGFTPQQAAMMRLDPETGMKAATSAAFSPQSKPELVNMTHPKTGDTKSVYAGSVNEDFYSKSGYIRAGNYSPSNDETSLQRNLEAAGYVPGTPEFQQAMTDQLAKTNGVTVNLPKGADELSKIDAQYIGDLRNNVQKMRSVLPDLQRVRQSLDEFGTGPTASIRLFLGSLAGDMGLPVDPSLSEGELIQSIQSRLAPAMRQTGSGSSSDRDVTMFMEALPNLMRTPQGNRLVIDHLEKLGRRQTQELQFLERYYRDNNYSLAGAFEAMDRELGPIFSKEEIAALKSAPQTQAQGLPRMPQNVPPLPEDFVLVE
jgi:antitoxin component of RelBE/YafQ-DinJ toxin-antitoxin module